MTGASSGPGKAITEILAEMGANIIMVSRQNARGEAAYSHLCNTNKGNIDWIPTDLSSLESVRRLGNTIATNYPRVNFLFNCAGIQLLKRTLTADGLEAMFATNYLSHFLLTNLLFEKLLEGSPSRVITISGSGHKSSLTEGAKEGTIDFNDLQGENKFSFPKAAKQAVLAKILFTYELARKWQQTGIEACTLCPGLTKTNLVSNLPWFVRTYMTVRFFVQRAQSAREGASHLISLALKDDNINGKYFEGSRNRLAEARSSDESYELKISERLWRESELLVDQSFKY